MSWVSGVKLSRGLKWFLVLLIPLALVTRLAVVPDDVNDLKAALEAFLQQQQFTVVPLEKSVGGMPVLQASNSACRMLVMRTADQAWNQQPVRNLATPTDRIYFVIRGHVRPEFSTWLATGNASWSRLLRRLGLDAFPSHALAVVAPSSCAVERLPWAELR